MIDLINDNLPLKLPVEIICTLFFIFWLAPLLSRKIKVPSIILLIVFGIILGPNGLNLISMDSSIKLLSDIGIVFIMFLAGIELDANQIRANKKNSIVFGILTFVIPFAVGFLVFHSLLSYSILSSALIALMFSTQTLVSYPIVSRLGLTRNRSVISAVGGTIITDATVLFSIGIIVASNNGILNANYLLRFILLILGFVVLVGVIYPIIVRKFFVSYEENEYSRFSLILALLFLAASIAHLIGLEAIIGAFFAGLILNKYIPKNSALMSNLHFTGNAIFIPIFLFYVGMLIDYRSVINDNETLVISLILTAAALFAKFFAAWITGKIFKFTAPEIGLLFGLSVSHAAVVIATALIGYNIGVITLPLLNATVILILFSCIISSYVSEHYGRKIVISEQHLAIDKHDISDRVVVPYANPNTIDKLLDIAVATTFPNPLSVIYPLTIIMENDEQYRKTISINQKRIDEISKTLYSKDMNFSPVSRIDMNPVAGINRAVKELMATIVIVGWTGKLRRGDILGKNIDAILANSDIQIMVCHIKEPINFFSEVVVIVPEYAQYEKGFRKWLHTVDTITKNIAGKLVFMCDEKTAQVLNHCSAELKINTNATYSIKNTYEEIIENLANISNKTLVLLVFARDKSVSDDLEIDNFVRVLGNYEKEINFVIIVPEQHSAGVLPVSIQNEVSSL